MRTITLSSLYAILLCAGFTFTVSARNAPGASGHQGFTTPLVFVENKGQVTDQNKKQRADIDFRLTNNSPSVFIGNGLIQYQWVKTIEPAAGSKEKLPVQIPCMMYMKLKGANENAEIVKAQEADYHENYYLPAFAEGATASSYSKITYKDIYPGIDWVLYTQSGKMKYDFVVHEGGNVKDIQLEFWGDSSLEVKDGKFAAYTRYGSIKEDKPVAYEMQTLPDGSKTKKDVPAKFLLDDNVLSFETGAHEGDLVIDPTITWATYFGWDNVEIANSVATQYDYGFEYRTFFIGKTNSYANIAYGVPPQAYPHQVTLGEPYLNSGEYDGFVAAYNAGGIKQWATYYGGDSTDELVAGACDKAGNVYVVGNTRSKIGIATPGAWKTLPGGEPVHLTSIPKDGFVAKLNKDGSRAWGTFMGGGKLGRDACYHTRFFRQCICCRLDLQ